MTKKWNPDDYGSPAEDAAHKAQLEAEARRRGIEPWQLAAERAVPTNVVRGLVEDAYRSSPVTGGKSRAEKPKPRGTGWQDARPLSAQPGINYVDALCVSRCSGSKTYGRSFWAWALGSGDQERIRRSTRGQRLKFVV